MLSATLPRASKSLGQSGRILICWARGSCYPLDRPVVSGRNTPRRSADRPGLWRCCMMAREITLVDIERGLLDPFEREFGSDETPQFLDNLALILSDELNPHAARFRQ